ncbi:MAG: STAS domain-containing protein [Firmicutes bacterium]|nr:STAS domain-containing protein [Bacillota bacterium]
MELSIKLQPQGNVLNIILSGRLNYNTADKLDEAIAEHAEGMEEIRIDMSELVYTSSMGIRSLIAAKKIADKKNIKFNIVSPSEPIMEVFNMTGSNNVFDIVLPDKDENPSPVIYPLRPIQRLMLDTQFFKARSTMMNTGSLARLNYDIDLHIFAKAVNSIIADHDIFKCRFVIDKTTGDICQRFDGKTSTVVVEEMTSEEFEQIKGKLRKHYEIIDHQLWNFRLIRTPIEKYFLMDFFHAITDGTAMILVFARELSKRYSSFLKEATEKKSVIRIHRGSSYAAYIAEELKTTNELAEEGKRYWQATIEGFDAEKHLPPMDGDENIDCLDDEFEVPIDTIQKNFFRGKGYTEQTFFLGAALLTMAKVTRRSDVIMSWVHNGRNTKTEMELMGIMLEQFPIRWDFERGLTPEIFLDGLGEKIKNSMKYRKSLDYVYNTGILDNTACFILQKGAIGRRGKVKIGNSYAELINLDDDEVKGAENTIDIELNAHDDGTYSLVINYNAGCYTKSAMLNFAKVYSEMTAALQKEDTDLCGLLEL